MQLCVQCLHVCSLNTCCGNSSYVFAHAHSTHLLSVFHPLQGRVIISLQDLKQQGVIKERAELQHGKSKNGRLDFEMEWNSYLGIDSIEKQKSEQHGPDH